MSPLILLTTSISSHLPIMGFVFFIYSIYCWLSQPPIQALVVDSFNVKCLSNASTLNVYQIGLSFSHYPYWHMKHVRKIISMKYDNDILFFL